MSETDETRGTPGPREPDTPAPASADPSRRGRAKARRCAHGEAGPGELPLAAGKGDRAFTGRTATCLRRPVAAGVSPLTGGRGAWWLAAGLAGVVAGALVGTLTGGLTDRLGVVRSAVGVLARPGGPAAPTRALRSAGGDR